MNSKPQIKESMSLGLRDTILNSKTIFIRNFLIFKREALYFVGSVFFETLVYFYAFAMLLSEMINLEGFSYTQFFIPSIIALVGVQTAFVESAWNSLKRFSNRQSLIIYLSTQLRVEDIFTGELAWATAKSFIASLLCVLLLSMLNVFSLSHIFLVSTVILLNSWCFSALSLFLLSFSKSEMTFSKHHIFVMLPMVVFSNVFFPYQLMPTAAQWLATLSPLTHVTQCLRVLQQDNINQQFFIHLGVLLFMCLFLTYLAQGFIKKRVEDDVYSESSLS